MIPLYHQQIEPPIKPSRRGIAGAKWEAVGRLAGQVEQIAAAFGGRFIELANRNQVKNAIVKARDRWRGFMAEIEKDPDYAGYGEKFDTFYSGLREELQKEVKLPRAKQETESQLSGMREEWLDSIGRISDKRAIEDARSIRLQALNQAVQDRDSLRVMAELRESQGAMEFDAPDLAKIKETAIQEVIEGQTMDYARLLDDEGPLWLLGQEAQDKFSMEVSPEEHYFLDAEARNKLAVELGHERTNRRAAEEAADFKRRKAVLDFVQNEIRSGKLVSVDQLTDPEYQTQFEQKYAIAMGLTDEDRDTIENILADRANAREKDREAYSDEVLKIVEDAINAGDVATAQGYLGDLVAGGYSVDSMGRPDPDVLRYMEQLKRMAGGEALTGFDKDANRLWGLARDGRLAELRKELPGFLEKYSDKRGREEHQQLMNELQQQEQEREARGKTQAEEEMQSKYNSYFWQIFNSDTISVDELQKLDAWRYRNYPRNERDKNAAGIRESTFVSWGKLIETKIDLLQKRATDLRGREKTMGEERIRTYWNTRLKPLEGATTARGAKAMGEMQNKRDAMVLEYLQAVKDENVNPVEKAQELINAEAQIDVQTQFGPQYKQPAIPMQTTGGELMRQLGLGGTAVPEAAGQPAAPESITFRGEQYGRVQAAPMRQLGQARKTLGDFSRYAKYENGNLVIKRNKKTGELALYDSILKQYVKVDEARLQQFAAAWAVVQKYE